LLARALLNTPRMLDLRRSFIRLLAAVVLFLAAPVSVPVRSAQVPSYVTHCDVCQIRLVGVVYRRADKLANKDYWLCESCSKIKESCEVCERTLGFRQRENKLPDGRLYCERDWKTVVNEPREAERIFTEVQREVAALLKHWGEVPAARISFTLVDKDEFLRQYRRSPTVHNPESVMGLTRTRMGRDGKHEHDIFVLNGLRKEGFMAASAHELTHAWMAEHQRKQRALHDDTVEGFCELVAWKVMDGLQDKFEKAQIEKNTYTRGQLVVLRAAEDSHRFFRVVDWVLGGVDGWLEADKLDRVHVLRDDSKTRPPALATATTAAPWALPSATPAAAPDKLILRGLMGTPKSGQVALINDAMLKLNESARVRVGTTNLHVRCVEIRADAVVVEIEGAARQELALTKK
jgi:Protein DA1